MAFSPHFWTTIIGSIPHTEGAEICKRLATTIDIPAWPQLPRRSYKESMYVQYSPSLPAVVLDQQKEKISFDTQNDISAALEQFYGHYLADDVDSFGLLPDYAAGFYTMMETLRSTPGEWAKGQVTGPISFGLTVTDQNLRASLYDEALADVIVKNMAMNARWQIRQIHTARPNVVIFVDEPYLASFGSAYISLSREQVIAILNEVFAGIHAEGGLGGVHCCANTDWSVLLASDVDILNLDAFGYLENLSLYTSDLRTFIDRGGVIAWGIVPTGEEIDTVTPAGLAQRLRDGLKMICQKSSTHGTPISVEELSMHSLISPSCGLGSSGMVIAEKALDTLVKTGEILQKG
jgi:hypothetical protein